MMKQRIRVYAAIVLLCIVTSGRLQADNQHWSFNSYDFQYYMTAYITVSVNGVVQNDLSDFEIAAFCNDECRGIAKVLTAGNDVQSTSYGYLRIWSHQAQGETITFKVFQKSTEYEEDISETTLTFIARHVAGLPSAPIVLGLSHAIMTFADAEVKRICVENWDTDEDGELSYEEAAAVTDLGTAFNENKLITSFDEFRYFTGVTYLTDEFYRCSSLKSIYIPKNAFVGYNPLKFCTSLESIIVDPDNQKMDSRDGCNAIIYSKENRIVAGCKTTVIPDGIVDIGGDAFAGCTGLTELTLPESLKSMNYWAFNHCSGLTSLYIPKGVNSIYNGTSFANCSGLTSIVVDAENTVYDSRNNCNAIIETATNKLITGCENTVIPDDVVEINNFAFSARKMTSVVIPGNVKIINRAAFNECKELTTLVMKEGVETIGQFAFSECTSLTSVVIPSSVEAIGDNAFQTRSLTSVIVGMREPVVITANTFSNRANATLYVPYGCKAAYETANIWKNFNKIIEGMPGDANGDGVVNIADVTAIINTINGIPPAGFVPEAADANRDGIINIADVTGIINIINR